MAAEDWRAMPRRKLADQIQDTIRGWAAEAKEYALAGDVESMEMFAFMAFHGYGVSQSLNVAERCSNMNRSMEAHAVLSKAKERFQVRSYGIAAQVRLPGPSADRPNVYDFGTPYTEIWEELRRKDPTLYKTNGVLAMLERNATIKRAPERFIDSFEYKHPVIITFEERVFDQVIEAFAEHGNRTNDPAHIFNIETKDSHDEAVIGANLACTLARLIEASTDLDDEVDSIMETFEQRTRRTLLHTVQFY